MATHAHNPYDHIPEDEKIGLIDKLLKTPGCPIPPDYPLSREQKLDLFADLIAAGAIKYTAHQRQGEKQTAPPQTEAAQTPQDHSRLYSIIGTDLTKDVDVAISQKARQQGLYIIGANGTGKSVLRNYLKTPKLPYHGCQLT
jgi:hypothetical protein